MARLQSHIHGYGWSYCLSEGLPETVAITSPLMQENCLTYRGGYSRLREPLWGD